VADGEYSSIANCQTKITGLFRGIFGILFKNYFLFIQLFLAEPLKIFCGTPLHVHSSLMFCAVYNKHTAAVSTGQKADRASALRLSSVSQPCTRGIVTSGYGAASSHTRTDCLCLSLLSVYYKGSLVIIFRLLFCVSVRTVRTYRGRNIG